MNKKKLVILLDGYSYLYRYYYSCISLNNDIIKPAGVIYSMLNTLKNILFQYKPDKLIVIFDTHGNNFRKKIFPKYKNNRPPMPNNLKVQIPIIHEIIKSIGIPVLIIPNVEADDVIGTLSKIAEKNDEYVLIGTSDKDLAQLVTKNIKILNHINNIILGPDDIKIKYGVPPHLIIDLLSLVGDPSDNIPGVLGIGKKTAIVLLLNIGCIDKIYKNIQKVQYLPLRGIQGILKKLHDGKKMAFLSYKLAKIKINVNLKIKYEKLKIYKKFNTTESLKQSKYYKRIKNIKNFIKEYI